MSSFLTLPFDEMKKIVRLLRNPKAPQGPRVVVALLLFYIVWPADFLPDFVIPVFGWADDLGLLGLTVWWLHKEVERLSK